ncbi:N-acetylmuramoyl-L-alanine amidase [Neobacillus sp. NPDC093127]|uniref:N-acetylmuramoyl-L-alanine amidase n=1 Tax=Neobacillus sp. NPDC093127 TaxID=3364296 RepID=UPI0037F43393
MKIFLDAGHGGKDSGAVGFGLKEKDLTLTIVKKIGKLLADYEGVEVLYSRTDDRFLELSERAAFANKANADFCQSIHINATPSGTGFESFVHTSASAKSIAYQNEIHPEIMRAIGDVQDRGKKNANYAMVRQPNMPSILTESLFIDNPNDNKLLQQDSFLDKVAQGHVNGYVKAFGLKKKASVQPQTQPVVTTKNGWKKENDKWYFYQNGNKKTGWLMDKGSWYYLDGYGEMLTGWQFLKGKWYYLNPNGDMRIGWLRVNDKWYYLNEDGSMGTGEITVKGKKYILRANGSLIVTTPDGVVIE